MHDFHVLIPARYNSSRFPGKVLMLLGEQTILQRVYNQALLSDPLSITILTDDQRIKDHALTFTENVFISKTPHDSGTDRIAEYINSKNILDHNATFVNVQGDEPLINPQLILQVAETLANSDTVAATLSSVMDNQDSWHDNNIVKVVCDKFRHALYFSRSILPGSRQDLGNIILPERHIGLYAYKSGFLKIWHTLEKCKIEQQESLEQLRILWNGYKIKVVIACCNPTQDINTPEDLVKAKHILGL